MATSSCLNPRRDGGRIKDNTATVALVRIFLSKINMRGCRHRQVVGALPIRILLRPAAYAVCPELVAVAPARMVVPANTTPTGHALHLSRSKWKKTRQAMCREY